MCFDCTITSRNSPNMHSARISISIPQIIQIDSTESMMSDYPTMYERLISTIKRVVATPLSKPRQGSGVQQIQLRIEDRENRDLGAVDP